MDQHNLHRINHLQNINNALCVYNQRLISLTLRNCDNFLQVHVKIGCILRSILDPSDCISL